MIQNDNFYLAEAFNKLRLLDEDAFDLSADKGVVDELQSFVADDIEAPYEEEVIDVDADTADELQDNYIGKVIIECDSCKARVYKDVEDIIVDEESGLANIEEECPICGNAFGYKVIGKIEPYNPEEFEDKPEEEVEDEAEFSEEEIEEALKESLNEAHFTAYPDQEIVFNYRGVAICKLPEGGYTTHDDIIGELQGESVENIKSQIDKIANSGNVGKYKPDLIINSEAELEERESYHTRIKLNKHNSENSFPKAFKFVDSWDSHFSDYYTEIPEDEFYRYKFESQPALFDESLNEAKPAYNYGKSLGLKYIASDLSDLHKFKTNLSNKVLSELADKLSDMHNKIIADTRNNKPSDIDFKDMADVIAERDQALADEVRNEIEHTNGSPLSKALWIMQIIRDLSKIDMSKVVDESVECPHCGKNPCECNEECKSLGESIADVIANNPFEDNDEVGFELEQIEKALNEPNKKLRHRMLKEVCDDMDLFLEDGTFSDEEYDYVYKALADAGYWGTNESLKEDVEEFEENDEYVANMEILDDILAIKNQDKRLRKLDKFVRELDELFDDGTFTSAEYDKIHQRVIDSGYYDIDESLKEDVEVNINEPTAAEDAVKLEDSEQEPIKESMKLREDVSDVRTLVRFFLEDVLDNKFNDNLAYEVANNIPEYDVDWCVQDFDPEVMDQFSDIQDVYIEEVLDLLFANAPKVEDLGEDLEEVQSEDAEKLVDPEKDPVLNESAMTPSQFDKFLHDKESKEDSDKLGDAFAKELKRLGKDDDWDRFGSYLDMYKALDKQGKEAISKLANKLNEDLEEVSVKADDKEVNVSVEPNGEVHIDIAPEEENIESEAEMIAPLSDEEQGEILANDEVEEEPIDEFEVDEFDEESFDEIGESYLRRVYENVNSFNTSKVTYKKGTLTVEGLIKFNSGKEKTTSFVFENFKTTKRGKTLAEGKNETFSKSNRAFLLKGRLENKHFVSESLTYNYTAKSINESGNSEAIKVYGRAVKR